MRNMRYSFAFELQMTNCTCTLTSKRDTYHQSVNFRWDRRALRWVTVKLFTRHIAIKKIVPVLFTRPLSKIPIVLKYNGLKVSVVTTELTQNH